MSSPEGESSSDDSQIGTITIALDRGLRLSPSDGQRTASAGTRLCSIYELVEAIVANSPVCLPWFTKNNTVSQADGTHVRNLARVNRMFYDAVMNRNFRTLSTEQLRPCLELAGEIAAGASGTVKSAILLEMIVTHRHRVRALRLVRWQVALAALRLLHGILDGPVFPSVMNLLVRNDQGFGDGSLTRQIFTAATPKPLTALSLVTTIIEGQGWETLELIQPSLVSAKIGIRLDDASILDHVSNGEVSRHRQFTLNHNVIARHFTPLLQLKKLALFVNAGSAWPDAMLPFAMFETFTKLENLKELRLQRIVVNAAESPEQARQAAAFRKVSKRLTVATFTQTTNEVELLLGFAKFKRLESLRIHVRGSPQKINRCLPDQSKAPRLRCLHVEMSHTDMKEGRGDILLSTPEDPAEALPVVQWWNAQTTMQEATFDANLFRSASIRYKLGSHQSCPHFSKELMTMMIGCETLLVYDRCERRGRTIQSCFCKTRRCRTPSGELVVPDGMPKILRVVDDL